MKKDGGLLACMKHFSSTKTALLLVLLFLLPLTMNMVPAGQDPALSASTEEPQFIQARAQTTWSGTQTLSGSYTIGVADEVIIQPCTVVRLPANERIIVDGRLTVLGTQSCPVILEVFRIGRS